MRSPAIQTSSMRLAEKMRYSHLQVLKSAAGFYIGTMYKEPEGYEVPGTRDSQEYFSTRELAEAALGASAFTQRWNEVPLPLLPDAFKQVTLTEEEVTAFNRNYPASPIEPREICFLFDGNGSLVDHSLRHEEDGLAAALAEEAFQRIAQQPEQDSSPAP